MAAADGLLVAAATGLRWWEVELHRLKAVSLSAQSNIDAAQACLQRALQVARQQHAKSLELRASTSLARLWCDQARTKEARELLAPVYGWFTEGFDTPDLQEARALLNVLNS